MALLSVTGFASTAALAVFALFNVATRDSYNPNLPVEAALVPASVALDNSEPQVAGLQLQEAKNIIKLATATDAAATDKKIEDTASGGDGIKADSAIVKVSAKSDENSGNTASDAGADNADTEEASGLKFTNPPARSAEEQTRIDKAVAALKASVKGIDYERARFHPIHFKPQIQKASNEECLVCHEEIMTRKPREISIAGVKAKNSLAWYQTLDTYTGKQQSFHYRHLESEYAKKVMNMSCTFCHQGNSIREESPDMQLGQPRLTAASTPNFTLRKMVNPSTTCLRCHGEFPYKNMDGVEDEWHIARQDLEDEDVKNGCLSCHGEDGFRTNRHNVTYLNAANIEELAKDSSDVCFGCHGGRQWYRISYPYPRHAWPDMDTEETPDWAKGRPVLSDPKYQRKTEAAK